MSTTAGDTDLVTTRSCLGWANSSHAQRVEQSEDRVAITHSNRVMTFDKIGPGEWAALSALNGGDCTEAQLATAVVAAAGELALLRWHLLKRRLDGAGLLNSSVHVADRQIARVRLLGPERMASLPPGSATAVYTLAADVVIQVQDGALTVRAPHRGVLVSIAAEVVELLPQLASPGRRASEVESATLPAAAVHELLALLAAAGVLVSDSSVDAQDPSWSTAEWWFHSHSRIRRSVEGYGGTYRTSSQVGPPPLRHQGWGGTRVPLEAPDLAEVAGRDLTVTAAIEQRRSIRSYHDTQPITQQQLAELLYRTVRLRRSFIGQDGQELADRPIPSGGAVHELEIYPLINACDGVPPGLWHYDSAEHELERVAEPDAATASLLASARASAIMQADPQVVLLVAARFGRVMWKYESVGYALTLKHVGVFYQTAYLVATSMGIGACALGGGDAEAFGRATGLGPRTEGTVGEMVIGTLPSS